MSPSKGRSISINKNVLIDNGNSNTGTSASNSVPSNAPTVIPPLPTGDIPTGILNDIPTDIFSINAPNPLIDSIDIAIPPRIDDNNINNNFLPNQLIYAIDIPIPPRINDNNNSNNKRKFSNLSTELQAPPKKKARTRAYGRPKSIVRHKKKQTKPIAKHKPKAKPKTIPTPIPRPRARPRRINIGKKKSKGEISPNSSESEGVDLDEQQEIIDNINNENISNIVTPGGNLLGDDISGEDFSGIDLLGDDLLGGNLLLEDEEKQITLDSIVQDDQDGSTTETDLSSDGILVTDILNESRNS